jgi:hypothetical protein
MNNYLVMPLGPTLVGLCPWEGQTRRRYTQIGFLAPGFKCIDTINTSVGPIDGTTLV